MIWINYREIAVIRVGKADEEYEGLNGRMNSLENLILAADGNGPFGSHICRFHESKVVPGTANALQIIFLRPSTADGGMHRVNKITHEHVHPNQWGKGRFQNTSAAKNSP